MERYTNAAEMARAAKVDDKKFRARLRRDLEQDHVRGSWRVLIGSDKHKRMQRVLDQMAPPPDRLPRSQGPAFCLGYVH